MTTAEDIAARLGLAPHPEGGFYRETFRHEGTEGERGAVTVIYYLLREGERSAWHRIDATEIWHHYAGAPLALTIAETGAKPRTVSRRMRPYPPVPGNPPNRSADGCWPAVPWRRRFCSRGSKWRRRIGSRRVEIIRTEPGSRKTWESHAIDTASFRAKLGSGYR